MRKTQQAPPAPPAASNKFDAKKYARPSQP